MCTRSMGAPHGSEQGRRPGSEMDTTLQHAAAQCRPTPSSGACTSGSTSGAASAGPPPPAASAAAASDAGPGAGSARSMAASGSCGSAHAKTSDRFWRPGTSTCAAAAAWAGGSVAPLKP